MASRRLAHAIESNDLPAIDRLLSDHPKLREHCASFGALPKLFAMIGYKVRLARVRALQ